MQILASDVNWENVGKRIIKYREFLGLQKDELADKIQIPLTTLVSYESGKERKSTIGIIDLCQRCKLSAEWVLLGNGYPFDIDNNLEHSIDPLHMEKKAGVRRPTIRKEAEEGIMDDNMLEFILTVDEFKNKNKKLFPTWSEVYQIMLYLGYRKTEKRCSHIDFAR